MYRLTLAARREGLRTYNLGKAKGPGGGEQVYSAADVEALIPLLRRQNARGYDVYVTPLDPAHHFLVVDDMRDAGTTLRTAGWAPALVQSSSPGNWQAVLKAPRLQRPDEQSIANELVQRLNTEHGDPAFSGVVHPFRMAGFSNKKAGRGDLFTRLVEAAGGICRQATRWLGEMRANRDRWAAAESEARQAQERAAIAAMDNALALDRGVAPDVGSPAQAFSAAWEDVLGWVQRSGWKPDASRMDWQVALRMLRADWSNQSVVDALLQVSPDVRKRHKNARAYAERTVQNAWLLLQQQEPRPARANEQPVSTWRPPSVS